MYKINLLNIKVICIAMMISLLAGISGCSSQTAAERAPGEQAKIVLKTAMPPIAENPADAAESEERGASADEKQAAREKSFRTEDEQNTVDIFDAAAPGTVFVTHNRIVRDWWSSRTTEVPEGAGTGFIWDKEGHIVTNFHVVARSIGSDSDLTVTLYNQKIYPARLVGGEPKKDIAVLKIDAPASELTPIRVPEDGYELAVGQKTIAIGNPYGLDHTLTTGIISAMGRDQQGYGGVTIRDMIQTDASINPGNSGGPLLDSGGRLIGMNTMIYSSSGASAGIGFAVPFMTIKRVVPQIIRTGRAQQIGIGVSILPDRMARRNGISGVIIRSVRKDSPAAKAGLRGISQNYRGAFIGDVIIGIGDQKVSNYDDLYNALDVHKAGDSVDLKIRRGTDVITVPVEVYVLPD